LIFHLISGKAFSFHRVAVNQVVVDARWLWRTQEENVPTKLSAQA